ncbi:MAG: EamA family transporter [Alphaproteobacteria bacterium]|nr:EamA family transporter [Alphaproteobacteria bacterium]
MGTSLWHRHAAVAYGAVFVGVCGHASTEFVQKLTHVAGPELSVWRFLLGGAGLVVVALALPSARDLLAPLREHGLRIAGLSLLGITAGYLVFHWSLDFATVPAVATIVTTIPIFVALVNSWVNRQPITAPKIISGAAAIVGIALLMTDGYLAKLAGSSGNLVGIFLAMTCAALVAAYTVLVRPLIREFGALRLTALTMMIGALGLWLIVGAVFGTWVDPTTLFDRPAGDAVALITIAVWNTTITQFLWIGGLAAVPDITRGSYLFFMKPVIASFLAVVFLGTLLTIAQILAICVICGSVALEWVWTNRRGGKATA